MSAEAETQNDYSGRIRDLAKQALQKATKQDLLIATAESCTGGLVAGELTAIPGCSSVFECGFITYSNEAKAGMLGVDPAVIEKYGAVSKEVAIAMAAGALEHSRASLSVGITGIAGPDGGTPEKPVGLVHFAAARSRGGDGDEFFAIHKEERFGDIGREEVRARSVETALRLLLEAADLS